MLHHTWLFDVLLGNKLRTSLQTLPTVLPAQANNLDFYHCLVLCFPLETCFLVVICVYMMSVCRCTCMCCAGTCGDWPLSVFCNHSTLCCFLPFCFFFPPYFLEKQSLTYLYWQGGYQIPSAIFHLSNIRIIGMYLAFHMGARNLLSALHDSVGSTLLRLYWGFTEHPEAWTAHLLATFHSVLFSTHHRPFVYKPALSPSSNASGCVHGNTVLNTLFASYFLDSCSSRIPKHLFGGGGEHIVTTVTWRHL